MSRIIVVEGKHDEALRKVVPGINTVSTNGTEISLDTIDELIKLSGENELVLMLDPDGPGEQIRRKISKYIPNVKHIYVDSSKARSKTGRKVGIEHLSENDILFYLGEAIDCCESTGITHNDLLDLGLIGSPNSSEIREYVGNECKIGYSNSKTFLKKVNLHGLDITTLLEKVDEYKNK